MEILEAFDRRRPDHPAAAPTGIDPFLAKVEELVERSARPQVKRDRVGVAGDELQRHLVG